MAPLHTWAGLLAGWLLYFMFVTGTAGYLDTEIDRWMRPELPMAQYPLPAGATAQAAFAALDYLGEHAAGARRWTVQLPVDRNEPYLSVAWQPPGGQAPQSAWLDARSGAPIAVRDSAGGQALYQMHWRLHYLPRAAAEALVSMASMALLLALLTGIVVHRRLFADLFTLRLGKGQRSWLDAHNLMSVVALPFQLMISYSGLVFLMFSFMPAIATAWYATPAGIAGAADSVRAFYEELLPPLATARPAGRPAPLAPVAALLDDAQSRLDGSRVSVLDIQHPGDAHARITVIGNFAQRPMRSAAFLAYDGASGALVAQRPAWQSTPRATRDVLLGLHEGLFAGPLLRALYLLGGLLGSAMVATGLVLWTVKRGEKARRAGRAPALGQALVERLNVAAVFGLPIAMAAYLWANRLLPPGMAGRAALEIDALFLAWLAMAVHALLTAPARAWRQQAWVAALGFAGLPVLNALTTQRHLGNSLAAGDWVMAGMDLGALGLACAFALVARGLGRLGRPVQ